MDARTLRLLEFHKIKDMLAEYASSVMGRALVESLQPEVNAVRVERHLLMTDEARMLHTVEGFAIQGFKDVRRAIQRAFIGAELDIEDLLYVADTLRCSRVSKAFLLRRGEKYPLVAELAITMEEVEFLENEIYSCIDAEGFIKDSASSKLRQLRGDIRRLANQVQRKLEDLIRSTRNQKYLQEAIITVRNDRYVVPVKSEYKGQISGLVHDQSASGATLFVEPMAVVELSNSLKQKQAEEAREIQRIIRYLSGLVAENVDTLEQNANVLSILDFLLAKGRFSAAINGVRPQISENNIVKLHAARHPLIEPAEVVPIDVELGKDFYLLVITGPNTGGKTVSLKTIGLLQVMAQSGLHIPVGIHSTIAVFNNVLADIGDEQSIEQSLSTFSSHMTNIIDILQKADENSLVLFDELGAGTDPAEGAALAMALLDEMFERKTYTVATTHYSELKSYAYNRESVVNASVEFDVDTLRPTYRLSIGIPGKSNAFLISQRLGLDSYIIEKARTYLSQEEQTVQNMLIDLEANKRQFEQARKHAEQENRQVNRIREEYQQKLEQLKEMESKVRKEAMREARMYVQQHRKLLDEVIKEAREMAQSHLNAEREDAFRRAREDIKSLDDELEAELAEVPDHKHQLTSFDTKVKVGDTVWHQDFSREGAVLTEPSDAGEVQIQIGSLKVWAKVAQLRKVQPQQIKKQHHRYISRSIDTNRVPLELDLRGKTIDEAQVEIDKYLDHAVLAGREEVSIIHGKGTGALRNGVNQYLKTHPAVAQQRLGQAGEGGSGVTVVTLTK